MRACENRRGSAGVTGSGMWLMTSARWEVNVKNSYTNNNGHFLLTRNYKRGRGGCGLGGSESRPTNQKVGGSIPSASSLLS